LENEASPDNKARFSYRHTDKEWTLLTDDSNFYPEHVEYVEDETTILSHLM